jgi:hypothetical protein
MNLDFEDLTVNDPESRGMRPFGICQGNYQVSGFGIKRPFDIAFGWFCGSPRMRVIDCHQFFTTVAQISKRGDQLCRIYFIRRRIGEHVCHRDETVCRPAAYEQSAGFMRIVSPGMLDHAIQQTGCNNEIHIYIMAGKACRR